MWDKRFILGRIEPVCLNCVIGAVLILGGRERLFVMVTQYRTCTNAKTAITIPHELSTLRPYFLLVQQRDIIIRPRNVTVK